MKFEYTDTIPIISEVLVMDEMNAWSVFLTTGTVLDYLRYSAIRDSGKDFLEENNENNNRRTDNFGNEYRGAR